MDKDRGVIYCLKDPNTKIIRYIGQTIQDVELRLRQHMWYSTKHKNHLGNWLNSLDNNPLLNIIEKCDYNKLDERELYWISYYNGNKLVNSMIGCELSKHHTHSEESKRKIGESTKRIHTGRKRSLETRKKLSIAAKKRNNIPHPNMYSKDALIKKAKAQSKSVYQFDKQGNFIKEWESITIASKTLKIHKGNISSCCRGKYKSAGKYVWKFKIN